MKSPFPGMDPYLERYWRDVHTRFMVYACDQIQEQLPGDLAARVEEGVAIDFEVAQRTVYPDVKVVERPRSTPEFPAAPAALAVAEPLIIELDDELFTQRHIVIIDRDAGNRVVTAIELLSPTNKTSTDGRTEYRKKQREYRAAKVNLVEIDLLRGGDYVLATPLEKVPPARRAPYMVSVRRAALPTEAHVYPLPLRERLPGIKIPLRPTDVDVALDLQMMIDLCYTRGRYSAIDYAREPEPPFSPDEATWADRLLREDGRR